jgi:glycosyltransferase involved in cell wall biosynthesis
MNNAKIRVLMMGMANTPGGVALYTNTIANFSNSDVFSFAAIVPESNGERFLSTLITLHYFDPGYSLITLPLKILHLRRIILSVAPDVIHLHTASAGLLGLLACRGLGIPIVYSGHAWRFEQKKSWVAKFVFRRLERYISKSADFVTFLTKRDRQIGIQMNLVADENSSAINTRIDMPAEFAPTLRRNSIEPPLIINVGRLSDQKNPLLFLDIAAEVIKVIPNAAFEWVGDGELRQHVNRRIQTLGLEKTVRLLGSCANSVVQEKLANASLFLFTSKYEGLPISLVEAKLRSIPVVSSNYPGVESIVRKGVDGYIFDMTSPKDGAEAVLESLSKGTATGEYVYQGFRYASDQHCNPNIMAKEFCDIYLRLAAQ